jgi:hypothetical protein
MSKGSVLDESMINSLGFADQLLTLTGTIENRHHPVLQEPLFVMQTKEITEPVYLERKYVFDNQVSIKSTIHAGERVLAWLAHSLRPNPHDPQAAHVEVLIARDLFLLGDWREFQRFKQFLKSQRILDAQARQWLSDHRAQLEQLSGIAEGLNRIGDCLGRIAEWPELEGSGDQARLGSLEAVAKTFSKELLHVRDAPLFPLLLLRKPPDARFRIFRMMSFVEDPQHGASGLVKFLTALARATHDEALLTATGNITGSRELARALAAMRTYLMSAKMPAV